jgi:hypothetical protein
LFAEAWLHHLHFHKRLPKMTASIETLPPEMLGWIGISHMHCVM